jgi:prepilin-type N-terminal cleavage/methylation domain-containing protein
MPHAPRPRSSSDSGFTLVEVCVAMALLALAASGLAHMCAVAIRATQEARLQTSTTVLAGQKLEELRGLRWTVAADGSRVSDRTTDLAVDPAAGGGRGLSASPADSLDANVPGCVDYLTAGGEWAGTGPAPPATARYLRRWSIRPLPEDPDDTLILQVLVTTVERDRRAATPRQRLAGDALVTSILTRRAP